MNKPKLVIFDMDGTMLDTEPISLAGMIEAGKALGRVLPREVYNLMTGRNAEACRRILREHGGTDFEIEKAEAIHIAYVKAHYEKHGIPVKPGLFSLLDSLEGLGIKKCVATSTDKKRAAHKLTLTNLLHRFDAVVGGDEVEKSKPDPEIFLEAAARCGVAPEDCVVIEDSPAGAEGAFRAGMRLIIVPDIAPVPNEVRAMAAAVCKDLFEAAEIIRPVL